MTPKSTILFLCQYGGAKSVIAASYFNRLAERHALPYAAVAAAAEEPYEAVPPPVVAFLDQDGFAVGAFKPRHVEAGDVQEAARVIGIDCDLAHADAGDAGVERWDDVPKVSDDLEASAAAIRRHVEELAAELRERR
jgi:protein-tyrosine-phosphatase